jgi:hypothetical protein
MISGAEHRQNMERLGLVMWETGKKKPYNCHYVFDLSDIGTGI